MCSPVKGPVQCNLEHPVLYRAFCCVVKKALPVQMEKALLNDILSLAPVTYNPQSNPKDQPGIPVKQNFQRPRIVCLQAKHRLVISGYSEVCEFWRRGRSLLAPGHGNGKGARTSLRKSTHQVVPSRRPIGDAIDGTTVASENSPGEVPMVSRQYTKRWAEEKIFR